MEILKKFKTWLSFKKEVHPRTDRHQQDEKNIPNEKKRSIKRNAEPISEEESVRRKYHRTETVTEAETRTQSKADKNPEFNIALPKTTRKSSLTTHGPVRNVTTSKGDNLVSENENNTPLNDYEVKTIGSIHEIREKCQKFDKEIEYFTDITGSKQFLYVDENLQSHIDKLDRIDAKESIVIRKERKSAVRYICLLIERLEAIAKRNQEQLVAPKQPKFAPISREQFLEGKKEE